MAFGRRNPMPFRLGGGRRAIDVAHMALLDAFAPGWDVSDDTAKANEAQAFALILSIIWACNGRLKNQALPLKMLEALADWEEAANLRPTAADRDVDRRRRLAAKLRGIAGNTVSDISDACAALLGANFETLVFTASGPGTTDDITYWSGVNPGPPGFEWCTNRALLGVRMNMNGLSTAQYQAKREECRRMLDDLVPAWMAFSVGVSSSFVVNQGVVGITLL